MQPANHQCVAIEVFRQQLEAKRLKRVPVILRVADVYYSCTAVFFVDANILHYFAKIARSKLS
jgi:hypothetical protein